MKTSTKIFITALVLAAGAAVSAVLILRATPQPVSAQEIWALLRACGPDTAVATKELEAPAIATLIGAEGTADERADLVRAWLAVPPRMRDGLAARGVKLSVSGNPRQPRCGSSDAGGDTGAMALEPGGVDACFVEMPLPDAAAPPTAALSLSFILPDGDSGLPAAQMRRRVIHQALLPAAASAYLHEVLEPSFSGSLADENAIDPRAALIALKGELLRALSGSAAAPFLAARYGTGWADAAAAAEHAFAFATDAFYCSAQSRARLRALYPAVEAAYAAGFQCVFGRPWYEQGAICGA